MAFLRPRFHFSSRLGALGLATALGVGLITGLRASAPAAGEPYKIGAVLSQSGPASTLGRPEAASVRLAVDEINRAGGIAGHPIELTIIDDESVPANTVNGVRRLLDQKVAALIAGSTTPTSMAIVPLVDQNKIPLINFASSADTVAPASTHPYSFKNPPLDTQSAQALQKVLKAKGLTKVGMLYRNDDYGKQGVDHFKQAGESQGFQVVAAEAMDATATDVTTQLTRLRAANPQAIIVWSTLPSIVVAAKNYKQLGLNIPLYFSDGAADARFPKLAGDALNGANVLVLKIVVADQLAANDPQRGILLRFKKAFEAVDPQDSPPSIFAAFGYDAPYWLRDVMAKAGTDPQKIRDGLEHLRYTGVTGVFKTSPQDHVGFDPSGWAMTVVENGTFKMVK